MHLNGHDSSKNVTVEDSRYPPIKEEKSRQRPTLEHRTEISRSKSGAEGERAQARNSGPRGLHPYTETMGMFYQELTKASWPGSEKAWVKTGLAEHSGQGGLLRPQEQWQRVFDSTRPIGFVGA
ncbi:hypothetical protein ACRRTK_016996 [Alexandromys fortis]